MKVLYINEIFHLPEGFTGDKHDALELWLEERRVREEKIEAGEWEWLVVPKKDQNKFVTAIQRGFRTLSDTLIKKVIKRGRQIYGFTNMFELQFLEDEETYQWNMVQEFESLSRKMLSDFKKGLWESHKDFDITDETALEVQKLMDEMIKEVDKHEV